MGVPPHAEEQVESACLRAVFQVSSFGDGVSHIVVCRQYRFGQWAVPLWVHDVYVGCHGIAQVGAVVYRAPGQQGLPSSAEGHQCEFAVVEVLLAQALTDHSLAERLCLVAAPQLQVECGLVGMEDTLQRIDGLVVLHHLHLRHSLRGQVLGGLIVSAAQEVVPLYEQFVDALALVGYVAIVLHLYAGHLPQHVLDVLVALSREGGHVVLHRVANGHDRF